MQWPSASTSALAATYDCLCSGLDIMSSCKESIDPLITNAITADVNI